ncbi:hypothetical protein [Saccharothrix deserti]|uniref:hypothetical protein n=1 Tax=Saccharothrix deserti TaxID=2593674 RepID=UPI00192E45FF|nr:hypothetical protein [Saccharothrix deserti]
MTITPAIRKAWPDNLAKGFPGTWEHQQRREWRPRPTVTASPLAEFGSRLAGLHE